ncbi:MAG: sigma-70 family RNA polymerase sigma factor [Symploca sp. SIO2E9]|nr:sigma-70 family RNA polymerase sigma factor [Symploca sp. SIO2E9]
MQSSDIGCNCAGTLTGTAPDDIVSKFWQQWQENQDKLYPCCLKLMNFNSTDAEDALSRAMLKAWEKVQKYAGKINNLQAWLVQLTRNLCIDIIRQRSKEATVVESLEWVGARENVEAASAVDTPEKALEKEEKAIVIKDAIASLPERLRNSFILHFYQQRSHTEIAAAQGISYDNVCKRISLARKQLKEKLRGYFQDTDGEGEQAFKVPLPGLPEGFRVRAYKGDMLPGEVATAVLKKSPTPRATVVKQQQREPEVKKDLDSDMAPFEDSAVETTSTLASVDLISVRVENSESGERKQVWGVWGGFFGYLARNPTQNFLHLPESVESSVALRKLAALTVRETQAISAEEIDGVEVAPLAGFTVLEKNYLEKNQKT